VIKFSQQFISRIEAVRKKHYILKGANVNFILYWKKEGADTEYKIILPELYFERYEMS
jgi:ATP-dependent DNA helicase RecQ